MYPPNSYGEALTPSVMILGHGAFRKQFGLNEVLRVEPHEGFSFLIRRGRDNRSLFLYHVKIQQEDSYLRARKCALSKNQICQHLDLGLPGSRSVRKKKCLLFKPPQSGVFCYSSLNQDYEFLIVSKS